MPEQVTDERWMRRAIKVARSKGSDPASSPLGYVIVLDGEEIAGELELRGATLYSTLQPCGMCTMASIWSKVGRVVYGAGRDDVHPM